MDEDVVYNVILPTLARKDAALICITTLDNVFNFWTRMINQKDEHGRSVFKTFIYSLVCDECKKKGIEESCEHKIGDIPYWQSAQKHRKLKYLMQGHMESYLRETKYVHCTG